MEQTPSLPPLPANPRPTEGTAVASLVLSILGFVGLGPLGWIPGIICGHIARSRIRQDPTLGGDGLATAGLVISYIGMALLVLAMIAFALFFALFAGAAVYQSAQ